MNPNDPQQNPLNNAGNQAMPSQEPGANGVVMPTPDAAPQDWSQPQPAAQPDPMAAPQPTTFAPQDPTQMPAAPVMGGDMSGTPTPMPAAMPTPDAGMPGQMPSSMPGQSNVMGGMPTAPMPGGGNNKRRIVMVAVLLLALVVLVGGGWYAVKQYHKNHDKNTTNAAAKKSETSTSAPDINTLSSFTFVQPPASKLSGYTVSAGQSAGQTNIAAPIGSDTDNTCQISYGVFDQNDLPGGDIGDVVSKVTVTLKNGGVSVSGPNAIKALVLKNASSSATYSIPSVNFSYTKDGLTEVATYSISELKNQTHAAVLQICAGKATAATLTSMLNSELAPVAAAITVKTN